MQPKDNNLIIMIVNFSLDTFFFLLFSSRFLFLPMLVLFLFIVFFCSVFFSPFQIYFIYSLLLCPVRPQSVSAGSLQRKDIGQVHRGSQTGPSRSAQVKVFLFILFCFALLVLICLFYYILFLFTCSFFIFIY